MEAFLKINWNPVEPITTEPFVTTEYLRNNSCLYKTLYDKNVNIFSSDSSDTEEEESEQEEESVEKKSMQHESDKVETKKRQTKKKKKQKLKEPVKEEIKDLRKTGDGDDENKEQPSVASASVGNVGPPEDKSSFYVPGRTRRPRFPQRSALNTFEHAEFLRLLLTWRNKPLPSFPSPGQERDLRMYNVLKEVVGKEQAAFLSYARSQWHQLAMRHTFLHPGVRRYVEEAWQHRLDRVFLYPRFYNQHGQAIPLVYPSNRPEVVLDLQHDLLEMGELPKLLLPTLRGPTRVCTDYNKMSVKHPPGGAEHDRNTLFQVTVSQDKNAEYLAQTRRADVVISSSGLQHIINNLPPFDKTWDIPVDVKEMKYQENGVERCRRVVFVDKALPPKTMTCAERNMWYHKLAVKSLVCHVNNCDNRRYSTNADDETNLPADTAPASSNSTATLQQIPVQETETLCNDCNTFSKSKDKGQKTENNISCMTSSDESVCSIDLVIDYNSDTEKAKEKKGTSSFPACSCGKNLRRSATGGVEEEGRKNLAACALAELALSPVVDNTLPLPSLAVDVDEISAEQSEKESSPAVGTAKTTEPSKAELSLSLDVDNILTKPIEKELSLAENVEKTLTEPSQKKLLPTINVEKPPTLSIKTQKSLVMDMPVSGKFMKVPPAPKTNVTYRLWGLCPIKRNKEDLRENFLKGQGSCRELKLLVRCKMDACEKGKEVKPMCVRPKLEYQYEFGAEAMNPSEIVSEWTALQFRPSAKVARLRVNAISSEVVMTETLTLQTVIQESLVHQLRVRASSLGTLYSVLSHLVDLPPGHYLLSHSARNSGFASLHRHHPDGGDYDLHKDYREVDPKKPVSEEIPPWTPIDPNVVTPIHKAFKQIPATFQPLPYAVSSQAPKGKSKGKPKNKSKKKKRN